MGHFGGSPEASQAVSRLLSPDLDVSRPVRLRRTVFHSRFTPKPSKSIENDSQPPPKTPKISGAFGAGPPNNKGEKLKRGDSKNTPDELHQINCKPLYPSASSQGPACHIAGSTPHQTSQAVGKRTGHGIGTRGGIGFCSARALISPNGCARRTETI